MRTSVVFAASTLSEVELIRLAAGNSYKLTLNDANDTKVSCFSYN